MKKSKTEPQKEGLKYKSLIQKINENGDLVILGQKGTCKTSLLMHLARELIADMKNRVIIFETFPKWKHEFDIIPFMVIHDEVIQPKENHPYMQENYSYIQWSKDYTITNESKVLKFLKENRNCLFLIECDDMEKISAFMTFVIYTIYRKQYQRAYYERLDRTEENFWFLVEESHNLLDSSTIQKKTFQKLRKIHNEFRNLKMHLVCVALRLQDMNPKIRSKMSILLSRVSLDDYQLKIRALLRNSEYRDLITQLPKGSFVYPELDLMLTTKPFNQAGKPYEWKQAPEPTIEETIEPIETHKKKSFMVRFFDAITKIGNKKPEIISQKEYDGLNNLTDTEPEPTIKIVIEKPIASTTKPRATRKPKAIAEPTEKKITMESLRELYSPDSQASKDYEKYKRKALAEKKEKESKENLDQSVYSDDSEDTQESLDMEEDEALLGDSDMGW